MGNRFFGRYAGVVRPCSGAWRASDADSASAVAFYLD